jgi:hypothetical protein
MRLNICDLFVVGIARPNGGWSKRRPIAFIEENDRCVPLPDLLLPNDLDDAALARFVADRFAVFARPGGRVAVMDDARDGRAGKYSAAANRQGVAHPALAGVQR